MKKNSRYTIAMVVVLRTAAGCGASDPSDEQLPGTYENAASLDAGAEATAGHAGAEDTPGDAGTWWPLVDAGQEASDAEPENCGALDQACCEGLCNEANTTCFEGKCVSCGAEGRACCGTQCDRGLACEAGMCRACGDLGEMCCDNQHCAGPDAVCLQGTCTSCGESGQACCAHEQCSGPDTVCLSDTCTDCGDLGEPCCANDQCNGAATICQNGTCAPCGDEGESCCANDECNGAATICQNGTCAPCGDEGESCCANDECNGAATICQNDTCAPCGNEGESCCANDQCNGPNTLCDSNQCVSCGGDGEPCCGQACEGYLQCTGGTCDCAGPNEACCEAARGKTSHGCEFSAVQMPLNRPWNNGCFAVALANMSSEPAKIGVWRGATYYPADAFTAVVGPSGLEPYDLAEGLPPGKIAVLALTSNSAGGTFGCITEHAAVEYAGFEGTDRGQAFRIRTSQPVAAYQFSPYVNSLYNETSSATLLLPTSVWGTSYMAFGPSETSTVSQGALLAIAAKEADTHVTITPKVQLVGSATLSSSPPGEPVTYTVQAGEYIQFAQDQDLTGSLIHADKPVAVWGGSKCFEVGSGGCDSDQQQLAPIAGLGHEYVAVSHRRRATQFSELYHWRVVGVVDNTVLTYEPPMDSAPKTLQAGQAVTFTTRQPFVVRSQDSDHPFYAAAFMTGIPSGEGDPEWVNLVATDQYLKKYTFLVNNQFPYRSLTVVRRPGGGFYSPVALDCQGELTGWQQVGDYQYAHVELSNGSCSKDRRLLYGSSPFTATLWGWGGVQGSTSTYISYAYPLGAAFPGLLTEK